MKKIRNIFLSLFGLFALASCSSSNATFSSYDNHDFDSSNLMNDDTSSKVESLTSTDDHILIAYFTWSSSGNTQSMATYIQGKTNGILYQIQPEEPYTGSYSEVAYGRAQEEAESNARPEIGNLLSEEEIAQYTTIILGFPIWWHTAPMIIGTFLESYTWTSQTHIYPFSQSSSMDESQFEEAMDFVTSCASGATVLAGLFTRPSNTSAIDTYLSDHGLVI